MKNIIALLILMLLIYSTYSQNMYVYKNNEIQNVGITSTNEVDIAAHKFEIKLQFKNLGSFQSNIVEQKVMTEYLRVVLQKPEKKNEGFSTPSDIDSKITSAYVPTIYKRFAEIGYAGSLTDGVNSKFLLTTSHGVLFDNLIFAGAITGIGYDNKAGAIGIPLGIDLRVKLSKDEFPFWIGVKTGTFFNASGGYDTGFFYHPNLSVDAKAMKKSKLTFSVGYLGQQASIQSIGKSNLPIYTNISSGYFTFSTGISF